MLFLYVFGMGCCNKIHHVTVNIYVAYCKNTILYLAAVAINCLRMLSSLVQRYDDGFIFHSVPVQFEN